MHRLTELFSPPADGESDCEETEPNEEPSLSQVTVIEARVMAGDLFYYALRQAIPDLQVELVVRLDDVKTTPSVLFYSFINRGCDIPSIEKGLTRLRERFPEHPLVVVTDTAGDAIERVMRRHAVVHWIPASAGFSALVAAVRTAARTEREQNGSRPIKAPEHIELVPTKADRQPLGLTIKEHNILRFLHEGKSNKVIAHALGCSESTVKVHIANMMRKLRLHNRTQLALVYQAGDSRNGLAVAH